MDGGTGDGEVMGEVNKKGMSEIRVIRTWCVIVS